MNCINIFILIEILSNLIIMIQIELSYLINNEPAMSYVRQVSLQGGADGSEVAAVED